MVLEDVTPRKLSVDDVFRMVDAGVLGEGDRLELIDGVLYEVSRPGSVHSGTVAWLNTHLVGAAGALVVRVQDIVMIDDGFLSPDLMVVEPLGRTALPETARLAVEVSVTTQRHDRWKAGRYARAGIVEYWIVDPPARTVTVHRGPGPEGYAATVQLVDGDRLALPFADEELDVAELLGPIIDGPGQTV